MAQNASHDAVSADDLIKELRKTAINCAPSLHRLLEAAADMIEALDERVAIMSESKTGQWEKAEYNGYLVCSRCHNAFIEQEWLENGKWRYCPNCGSFLTIGEAEKIDI